MFPDRAAQLVSKSLVIVSTMVVAAITCVSASTGSSSHASASLSVIVRAPDARSVRSAMVEVRERGGRVGRRLEIINGFAAQIPVTALPRLRNAPAVASVTQDQRLRLLGELDGWDHTHDLGSMYYVAQEVTGAGEMWNDGFTGRGVDVALIDSGVVEVNGLATSGKLLHGPDLSFESQNDALRNLDTFGHGTHMAGIIAGRDNAAPTAVQKGDENFLGMAPDARIVSVKVADATGATDVSQVIAAIDWVVKNRRANGLNIRVLNLSFGTDGVQAYLLDPLAYAAEVAWHKGIVVVVAAGNGGYGSPKLNNPAYDPFVIAVGGADGRGTYDSKDDVVPAWSSYGDGTRNPDLVAPGKSVVSLRAPGSYLDQLHPNGRVGASRFFRGSGTSQAAAAVSGAAALVIQQRPQITPDQVKALLTKTAAKLKKADVLGQGAGMLDLKTLRDTRTPPVSVQLWPRSTGAGSLELARGSAHLAADGIALEGERDIFGAPWNGPQWALGMLAETSWSEGMWNGNTWTGNTWTGNTWTGNTWTGNTWTGNTWTGNTWTGNTWTGNTWTGNTWTGNTWSGNTWSGAVWGN